jgi:hypothetical protein
MLTPIVSYINRDLDGNAMKMDGYQLGLGYTYLGLKGWQFSANAPGRPPEERSLQPDL